MKKNIKDLDLGRFSHCIDKSKLTLNPDGTYDYNGHLYFKYMGLKSLDEIPIRFRKVSGDFSCSANQLISLQGAPSVVGEDFDCSSNQLISLQYAPSYVGIDFRYFFNDFLSREHSSVIGGKFDGMGMFLLDPNLYVSDKVIETVKQMTYEQQMKELDFFKKHDQKAFKMMKQVLDNLEIEHEDTFKLCYTIK
jgi:hypothetical protein